MMRLTLSILLAGACLVLVPQSHAATDSESMKRGRALYEGPGSCVICHMANGKGQPGSVPPLAGSAWLNDTDRTIAIVLRGLVGPVKVANRRYYSAMPPQLLFDDEKLADIINYVNGSWGNEVAPVTVERVASARVILPSEVFTSKRILKQFPFPRPVWAENGTFKPDFDDALQNVTTPVIYRTFMPGASPAAFAVALPGNQFYCWDAGECRLRYAWVKGGFIRGNRVHWSSNGKPVAQFFGDPYYRARSSLLKPEDYELLSVTNHQMPIYDTAEADDFPIRIKGVSGQPTYKGYRLIEGYPEFRYTLGHHEIRELINASSDNKGIVRSFSIQPVVRATLHLTPTELATFSSSTGEIAKDGSLDLSAKDSAAFSVTILEKYPAPPTPGSEFE
jgi:mono/diheme cytochrome c family protein